MNRPSIIRETIENGVAVFSIIGRRIFFKQILVFLVVLSLASIGYSSEQPEPDAVDKKMALIFQEKGQENFIAGRYQQAIKYYRQAIDLRPDCQCILFPLHVNTGLALIELQLFEEAMAQFNIAMDLMASEELKPEQIAKVHAGRGRVFFEMQNYRAAVEKFSQAILLNTSDLGTLEYRGMAYFRLGELESALADYDNILKYEPSNISVREKRARLQAMRKNYDEAIADYSALIEQSPETAAYWNDRGYTYKLQGIYTESLLDLNKALSLDPDLLVALENRLSLFLLINDCKESLLDLDRIIALDPSNGANYITRSACLEKIGGPIGEIMADLDQAETLGEKPRELYYNTGISLQNAGYLKPALDSFSRAINADPNWYLPYTQRAKIYLELEEFANSIADWQAALDIEPEQTWLYYYQAKALEAADLFDEAEQSYTKYLTLDIPSNKENPHHQEAKKALKEMRSKGGRNHRSKNNSQANPAQ